ncbi:MAG: LamB/YcsF family protein [Deltaproteobacteria bacterium]|nr:LamB/YcsF family protein [Deltaproteobacteria bacterium]
MKRVDINCDMGESFGAYRIGMDEEVLPYITSANIACGFHAGDPLVMKRTVAMAAARGVSVGAHPGFPDLMGFGRRIMECDVEEIRDYVTYQVGALRAFCDALKVKMQHVKPHGSLYNMAVGNEGITRAIIEAIASIDDDLIYVALAGGNAVMTGKIAEESGISAAFEAFPDRAYTRQGTLASRKQPGSVIKDPQEAADRALMMARDGKVTAEDGSIIEIEVHTLCVHGDNPAAVDLVRLIKKTLESSAVEVIPMGSFIQG